MELRPGVPGLGIENGAIGGVVANGPEDGGATTTSAAVAEAGLASDRASFEAGAPEPASWTE